MAKKVVFIPRPRDAIKAIKKRIVGNKNFREIMLALTVSNHLQTTVCLLLFVLSFTDECSV